MSIPDDTMRRLIALRLGKKLEPVLEVIADMLEPRQRKAAAKGARGTRLAEDWLPTAPDFEFAMEKLGNMHAAKLEVDRFRNYWCARADKGAVKLDWSRTFHNWVLNVVARTGPNGHGHRNGGGIYDVRQQLDDRRQRAASNPDLFDPSDD